MLHLTLKTPITDNFPMKNYAFQDRSTYLNSQCSILTQPEKHSEASQQ